MRFPELSSPYRQKVERWLGARGWGGEDGELGFNGDRASIWDNGKALRMDGGDGCPTT